MTPITYARLRERGFRICSTQADNKPHMVRIFGATNESAIELSPSSDGRFGWHCWLRSDMAHSRCRFVFARTVHNVRQLEQLWLGLTDTHLIREDFDESQFEQSLAREQEECERRYLEYARHKLRYGALPGG